MRLTKRQSFDALLHADDIQGLNQEYLEEEEEEDLT